jgi:hypothetical protein
MVLTVGSKIIPFIFLFCLNIIPVFSQRWEPAYPQGWMPESGLVQYGENIDRDRLELLEDKQLIHLFNQESKSMVTGIYTIRNGGDEYKTTIGILFQELQGGPNPDILNLQFFVDNEKVNYYKIYNYASVNLGEEMIELPQTSTCWALVDITFPKNSIVTVKVQHTGIYSSYNHPSLEYFPKLLYWKGPTKFNVEVINEFIYDKHSIVEYFWISNITFTSMTKPTYGRWQFLHTNEYLQTLQDMEKSIMQIQRKNENTFLIEFKDDFLKNYHRSIIIKWRYWSSPYFIILNSNINEITLDFLEKDNDITKRLLGTYELIFLTNNQLRVMRNAFYAQYGYIFKTEDMQAMFINGVNNYYQNPNFNESMLTDIDRANIETIKKLEALTEN